MDSAELIRRACDDLCALLLDKNRRYGNSALEPMRVFSQASPLEQINVRLDDKLSRIVSGQADDDEDAEWDMAGYLVLKRIARQLATDKESLTVAGAPLFPCDGDDDPAVIRLDGPSGAAEQVVHLVADKTSRGSLPDGCLGALCGRPQGGCRG